MADHDSLVTTDQFNAGLADVRGELRTEIAAVRVELASLYKRLTGEIAELRTELRTGLADVRTEIVGVHTEIAGVHTAIAKLGEQQARTETHRLRWTLGAIAAGSSLGIAVLRLLDG